MVYNGNPNIANTPNIGPKTVIGKLRNSLHAVKSSQPHITQVNKNSLAAKAVGFDGTKLTLEVFYKFHKERLQQQKCRQIVEQVTSQILKSPIHLDCILGEKTPPKTEK